MIVLDDKQKLIVSRLEVSNPLSSRMIKEYDFNNMRKEFKDLLDLMQENYFNQVCYQEFLKYEITEDLVFVTVDDPKYNVLTVDGYGRYIKSDGTFRVYSKEFYKMHINLCKGLLYRVRDSFNNLDEVERFIIKNFEFIMPSPYTDEALMATLSIHKDKYYDSKKSAYIKMGLQLNLDLEKRSDQEMKNLLTQGISQNIVTFMD